MDARKLQFAVVGAGTLFAWFTVVADTRRFLSHGGRLLSLGASAFPHPAVTPCFYGAIVFLVALMVAAHVLAAASGGAGRLQRILIWILGAGTAFGWINVTIQVVRFYCRPAGTPFTACSGVESPNPFFTACTMGSMLYLLSLLMALHTRRLVFGKYSV